MNERNMTQSSPIPSAPLVLTGAPLSLDDVVSVARFGRPVQLDAAIAARLQASREVVDRAASGQAAVYGVNTGFGSLSRVRISREEVREVQLNLVRSHAAGVGEELPHDVVRAMMLALAGSLSRGCSGVRQVLIEQLIALLNAGITPCVPSRGSVGASGDLAPLAHVSLVLFAEGEAVFDGKRMTGAEALQHAGITPLALEAKEGLALINGTHLMAGIGALAMVDIRQLQRAALAAASMSIDACRATDTFLDDRIHATRGQIGQRTVANVLRRALAGSQILTSHREHDPRVQDPYCLRAMPQVIGAAFDAIAFARSVVERELGAVTDNPLVFHEDDSILSGGNFHGMPLAIAFDTTKIALTHLAGIAERRVNWLLAASDGENPVHIYLSPQPGLHSGLMIAQYTAAACCNELQTLAHPASVGNIPTSAGMEDYNSMGATAALHLRQAIELVRQVIAIELLVMTEAMEYQRPLRSGEWVERTYETVRTVVPKLVADRPPSKDIAAIARIIRDDAFAAFSLDS